MCPYQDRAWQGVGEVVRSRTCLLRRPGILIFQAPAWSLQEDAWVGVYIQQAGPGGGDEKVTQSKPALFAWLVKGKRLWHTLTGTSEK